MAAPTGGAGKGCVVALLLCAALAPPSHHPPAALPRWQPAGLPILVVPKVATVAVSAAAARAATRS